MKTHKTSIFATLVFVLALALVAGCGGSGSDKSASSASSAAAGPDLAKGKDLFLKTCSACHGADARGLPNLGKSLIGNEFIKTKSLSELVDFVLIGRPSDHPDNTTGVAMLPKGGNPALKKSEILDIVFYTKSLN